MNRDSVEFQARIDNGGRNPDAEAKVGVRGNGETVKNKVDAIANRQISNPEIGRYSKRSHGGPGVGICRAL